MINGKIELKHTSNYYYQIQGQIHITKRNVCFFVVYTPQWTEIQKIKYDESFWLSKMQNTLQT